MHHDSEKNCDLNVWLLEPRIDIVNALFNLYVTDKRESINGQEKKGKKYITFDVRLLFDGQSKVA